MKNYKLKISYDGSRYHGWERKKNAETVEGKIEDVLEKMCTEAVNLIGAGRTDAGVHARGMVANVHMNTTLSTEEIQAYMNRYLPDDISIDEVKEASDRFHARYNARGKTYRYTCYEGEGKPVFSRRYVTVLDRPVNMDAMKKAAKYLTGEHDFRSFCGNTKMKKSTVRIVDRIEISRRGKEIILEFHGNGFLQNMVRIMTGTLLEVGYGRVKAEEMTAILQACDRQKAGPTAAPQGLCLMEVDY